MKKIKIVHVLQSVGGVDVYMRLLSKNINPAMFENVIIHGESDEIDLFSDKNDTPLKVYKLPITRGISFKNDLVSIVKTYRIIKKEKPDIIHAHSAKGGIIGRLAGLLTRTRVLFTPNAFSYLSEQNAFKRKVYLYIEKIFANRNSILLATSQSELERGIKEVGYKKTNTLLFNNSIQPILKINALSIDKTWPDEYICTVGRPSFQKNIELMVDIIHEIKAQRNIHLVLMGVGFYSPHLEKVKSKIESLGLEKNITLLEWCSREDVFRIINDAQLYISTARYEGLPYSVIESLALSKPCVVTDCDGNRDLITDGVNGYVIDDKDTVRFSNKVIELLNNDLLRKQFSANALKAFESKNNINENIHLLEDIYSKCITRE